MYNALQELEKLKLNATFGKMAWYKMHDITNQITGNKTFLLSEMAKGHVKQIKNINDNYVMYSGE